MADLNQLNSSDTVKIAGADSAGLETNFVNANVNGEVLAQARVVNSDGNNISSVNPLQTATTNGALENTQQSVLNKLVNIENNSYTIDTSLNNIETYTLQTANYTAALANAIVNDGGSKPSLAVQVAGSDGTDLQTLYTDTAGRLRVVLDNISAIVGQNTMANSIPVTVASNQSTLPVITTNASVIKAQLQDNAGNAIASKNSELEVRDIIDNAAQYQAISVTTSAVEAKGGATRLTNRKLLTITPTNGTVYWGTSTGVTVSNGTPVFKNQTVALSFSENVPVYLISAGTVDVRVVEGS